MNASPWYRIDPIEIRYVGLFPGGRWEARLTNPPERRPA